LTQVLPVNTVRMGVTTLVTHNSLR